MVYLSPTPKRKHQVQRGASFELVVARGFVIGHLLSTENQALLDRRNSLLLFNTFFDLGDEVVRLDVELDLFPGEGSDFDEHRICVTIGCSVGKCKSFERECEV